MDFLNEFSIPVIVGICLCIGFVLKNLVTTEKVNKFIPLIMGVLGVLLNFWVNQQFTAEVLLGGLFSGLASTGLYELFRNLINRGDSK